MVALARIRREKEEPRVRNSVATARNALIHHHWMKKMAPRVYVGKIIRMLIFILFYSIYKFSGTLGLTFLRSSVTRLSLQI